MVTTWRGDSYVLGFAHTFRVPSQVLHGLYKTPLDKICIYNIYCGALCVHHYLHAKKHMHTKDPVDHVQCRLLRKCPNNPACTDVSECSKCQHRGTAQAPNTECADLTNCWTDTRCPLSCTNACVCQFFTAGVTHQQYSGKEISTTHNKLTTSKNK